MYKTFRPLLFSLEPETSHHLAVKAAGIAQRLAPHLVSRIFEYEHSALEQECWGLRFKNPIGLAAGFDKNGILVPFWQQIGFGFAEIGSATARPSEGNPKPRLFRLPADWALVNRMGLNNRGAKRIAHRLAGRDELHSLQLGINIAKTHDPTIMGPAAFEDYRQSFMLLAPHADYVAINISCPNTREGKTFETPEALQPLLGVINSAREEAVANVPVLLKLSPPTGDAHITNQLDELIDMALDYGIDGFIATNTASDRRGCRTDPHRLDEVGSGGLSGAPLAERSTEMVRYIFRATEGRVPIIGVGGVFGPETAYQKIRAGASLIQLYTGLLYEGPGLVRRIKKGLVRSLERDGFASVNEAVGTDCEEALFVDKR